MNDYGLSRRDLDDVLWLGLFFQLFNQDELPECVKLRNVHWWQPPVKSILFLMINLNTCMTILLQGWKLLCNSGSLYISSIQWYAYNIFSFTKSLLAPRDRTQHTSVAFPITPFTRTRNIYDVTTDSWSGRNACQQHGTVSEKRTAGLSTMGLHPKPAMCRPNHTSCYFYNIKKYFDLAIWSFLKFTFLFELKLSFHLFSL